MKALLKAFLLTFVLVGVVLAAAGAYGWRRWHDYLDAPIASGKAEQQVVIEKGATFKQIIARLETEGLVADPLVFELYGRFIGAGTNVKAGAYVVDPSWTPRALLEKLQSGGLVAQVRVTIPEGQNRWQIAEILAKAGLVDPAKFLDVVERQDLEGRLFPDTYLFKVGAPLSEVTRVLTDRFDEVFESLVRGAPDEQRLRTDPEEKRRFVILASLVEKEAQTQADRPLIARVFKNRVEKGMKLETDPTCVYGPDTWREVPHPRYCRNPKNTYSTYVIAGFPPGPIANAGRAALDAALRPSQEANAARLLYFVAKRDGTGAHDFSETYEEHSRKVDLYLRGGR
jgi:UPF0755 protein